jgi:hypothetical protein
MLEVCELIWRRVHILHKHGESAQDSRKTVVPPDRLIEELRPTLYSVWVCRSQPGPREEARHA